MDKEAATEFALRALAGYRKREDVIFELCQRFDMSWDEAQWFVEDLEASQHRRIASRRRPLLIGLSLGFVLVGIVLALVIIVATLNGANYELGRIPIPYLGNAFYILTGIGMIGGGTVGLFNVFRGV